MRTKCGEVQVGQKGEDSWIKYCDWWESSCFNDIYFSPISIALCFLFSFLLMSEKNKVEWRVDGSCMETTIKRQNFPWQDCLVWDNINIDETGNSSSADFRESCPLPPNSEKWTNCCCSIYDLMTLWPHACVLLNPIVQLEMLPPAWEFSCSELSISDILRSPHASLDLLRSHWPSCFHRFSLHSLDLLTTPGLLRPPKISDRWRAKCPLLKISFYTSLVCSLCHFEAYVLFLGGP